METKKAILIVLLSLAVISSAVCIIIKNDAKVGLDFENSIKEDYHFEKKYAHIYASAIPLFVQTVPREGNITLGIDTGTTKINFGIVNVRTPVRKKLDFANNKEVPVKVILTIEGNISPYVIFRESEFVIEPNSTREEIVNFTGCPEPANLTGTIIVKMIVPKYPSLLWVY